MVKESKFMTRASLVKVKGSCGKPNYACALNHSPKHIGYYLSFSEKANTQMVYISKNRVSDIRQVINAWRDFKAISKELDRSNLAVF